MRYHILLFLMLAACGGGGTYRDTDVPMRSVTTLDTARYLGTWHEIARFPNSFEEGCRNVTATYRQLESGRIGVTNRCEKAGEVDIAEGTARVVAPGRLKVKFVSWLPFEGDYWVIYLSEDTDLAVVGVPSGAFGWILARDQAITAAQRETALGALQAAGYDTSALIWTEQG